MYQKVRVTSYLAIGQSTRSSTSYSSDTVPNLRRPRRYHFRPRKLDLPGAQKFQPLPTLHPKANFVHDTPSTETPTAMKLQTYYRNRKRMACAHPLLTLLIINISTKFLHSLNLWMHFWYAVRDTRWDKGPPGFITHTQHLHVLLVTV